MHYALIMGTGQERNVAFSIYGMPRVVSKQITVCTFVAYRQPTFSTSLTYPILVVSPSLHRADARCVHILELCLQYIITDYNVYIAQ